MAVLGAGGMMGFAMARNIARAGIAVRAWNRSRGKAEPLAADGAYIADTPADAAAGAGIVLTMLADADAARGIPRCAAKSPNRRTPKKASRTISRVHRSPTTRGCGPASRPGPRSRSEVPCPHPNPVSSLNELIVPGYGRRNDEGPLHV